MNAKRRLGIAVAVTAAVLACANTASAWWGFGHYRVAVEIRDQRSGLDVDPLYAMVPDAFNAKSTLQVISVPFTWSHGVQRLPGEIAPPAIPTYPDDGRFPGAIMYELTTQKMRFQTDAERLEAKKTAIGAVVIRYGLVKAHTLRVHVGADTRANEAAAKGCVAGFFAGVDGPDQAADCGGARTV